MDYNPAVFDNDMATISATLNGGITIKELENMPIQRYNRFVNIANTMNRPSKDIDNGE